MEQLRMALGENSYDILLERGLLEQAGKLLDLDRRVLIVTDTGVPQRYAALLAGQCAAPVTARVEQGEGAKSFAVLEGLLKTMLAENFSRGDCVVAPVSYTHLDVYKRQGFRLLFALLRLPPLRLVPARIVYVVGPVVQRVVRKAVQGAGVVVKAGPAGVFKPCLSLFHENSHLRP